MVMGVKSLSQALSLEYGIIIPEDRKTNEMVLEGTGYEMEAQIFSFQKNRRWDTGLYSHLSTWGL